MKGKDVSASPMQSPKVRVKPLKRRRIRLGNTDNELDESTMEILNAIRDIPSCCEKKTSSRKPLPAIGSQFKSEDERFASETVCSTSRGKKKPNLSNDILLIDDALTKNKDFDEVDNHDESKKSLRPRRRRERTFISSKKSDLLKEDNPDKDSEIFSLNQQEPKMDLDNNSVFSDLSEEVVKDRNDKRRKNRQNYEFESLRDDDVTNIRPSVKAGRRSTTLLNSSSLQISFLKESDLNPDTSRSSRSKTTSDDDFLLRLDQNTPLGFDNTSMSSETSKNEFGPPKRRSRRYCHPDGNLRNEEEDSIKIGRDNGFSDAASMFSDDFSETYDPSFNTKHQKTRKDVSSFGINSDKKDSNGGIFTSPQRHKKRSRHQQSKLKQNPEDNPLFSNEVDLLSTNSFSLPGENEEAPYLERKLYPKHQRRRTHKYLPPLSEHLSNSKQ